MTNAIVVQARMGSSRLPGKVLRPLAGRPMLAHLLERLGHARTADVVVVATSTEPADQALVELAEHEGALAVTGPEYDVLTRYLMAAEAAGADELVRVTSDCPLIDPGVIDAAVELRRATGVDYVSAGSLGGVVRGLDCEAFTRAALERADLMDTDLASREHVTLELFHSPQAFSTLLWEAPPELRRPGWRLCVDEQADLKLLEAIYERLWRPGHIIGFAEVAALLDAEPALAALNAQVEQRTYPGQDRPRPPLHTAAGQASPRTANNALDAVSSGMPPTTG
jgi:spore coat polysaccharide biosynthesis protein SpsF